MHINADKRLMRPWDNRKWKRELLLQLKKCLYRLYNLSLFGTFPKKIWDRDNIYIYLSIIIAKIKPSKFIDISMSDLR